MGYAKVRITPELLTEMFTEGWSGDNLKCIGGLPAGAKFVVAELEHGGDVSLCYAHETFSDIRSGSIWPQDLPEVTVTFHRSYPEDER